MTRLNQDRQPPRGTARVNQTADELVRFVSQLTLDVERFDSLITNQRRLLRQRVADLAAADDRRAPRQSRRIKASAAQIASRARATLTEVGDKSNVVRFRSAAMFDDQDRGARAEGQPTA